MRQYVDTTIGGYSPSLTVSGYRPAPEGASEGGSSGTRIFRFDCSELPYAASSIARIAVSGWLIGSTPTRLTIDVMVPSASASTQAARCSNPR